MKKNVVLVTGTPCVGKTTVAKELAIRLDGLYVNLTELSRQYDLGVQEDEARNTTIIDENKMRHKLTEVIKDSEKENVVIDGHYASAVTPKHEVTRVFVLRRNPIELHKFMLKCGFKDQKLWENLASEILDSCLVEAIQEQDEKKVCELNVTDKSTTEVVDNILAILSGSKECHIGGIDWLGMLEELGKTDEYLKL